MQLLFWTDLVFELPCCCGCAVFLYLLLGWLLRLGPWGGALAHQRGEVSGRHVSTFLAPGGALGQQRCEAPGAALRLSFLALGAAHLVANPVANLVAQSSGQVCGPNLVAHSCGSFFGRWAPRSATRGAHRQFFKSKKIGR